MLFIPPLKGGRGDVNTLFIIRKNETSLYKFNYGENGYYTDY
jgi:hypothetical protein